MARSVRIEYSGCVYHITSRGIERRDIYQDDKDRSYFLRYLGNVFKLYGVLIYGYCLLTNHYHLLLETIEANLSQAMQWLNTSYVAYFNSRHKRVGHLFQGRYKAFIIDKDSYLVEVSRYLHLNPVRARIVKRPEDYRWSSYPAYLGKDAEVEGLDTAMVLSQFGKKLSSSRRWYLRFVEEGIEIPPRNPFKNALGGLILGKEGFANWIRQRFLECSEDYELPQIRRLKPRLSIEEIVVVTSRMMKVDPEVISKRGRHNNEARLVAIYLSRRLSGEKVSGIGRWFGAVSGASISYICQKVEEKMRKDRRLREFLVKVEENLKPSV